MAALGSIDFLSLGRTWNCHSMFECLFKSSCPVVPVKESNRLSMSNMRINPRQLVFSKRQYYSGMAF